MKICFTGDVFLGGDLLNKSCENTVSASMFKNADMRIVNLEQPISDSDDVADKCTLYTGSFALEQLKELKVDAVNIAHNHIQDKGLEGISETAMHLDAAKIGRFGAGATLSDAQKPFWLTDDLAIMGYCEFGKPYLNQIEIAEDEKPGVNPLRLEKIKSDLDNLPVGKKAILYFHWGMEHVWLPPEHDIQLVKSVLEDDRVVSVIGMHAHRAQGLIQHAGKVAYMCLGNFIFPNFYMQPPTQIMYPTEQQKSSVKYTTRQYHQVLHPTYKKWRWVNRVSLMVQFDTSTNELTHSFVEQRDNEPEIKDLGGIGKLLYTLWIKLLSAVYKLPRPLYRVLSKLHASQVRFVWRAQIKFFLAKQMGFSKFSSKVANYVKKRFE